MLHCAQWVKHILLEMQSKIANKTFAIICYGLHHTILMMIAFTFSSQHGLHVMLVRSN